MVKRVLPGFVWTTRRQRRRQSLLRFFYHFFRSVKEVSCSLYFFFPKVSLVLVVSVSNRIAVSTRWVVRIWRVPSECCIKCSPHPKCLGVKIGYYRDIHIIIIIIIIHMCPVMCCDEPCAISWSSGDQNLTFYVCALRTSLTTSLFRSILPLRAFIQKTMASSFEPNDRNR